MKKLKKSVKAPDRKAADRKGETENEGRADLVLGRRLLVEQGESDKTRSTPPKTVAEARRNIERLVTESSEEIIEALIEAARSGKVAEAKYLFEVVGLHPATGETTFRPENSLAYRLLKRLGIADRTGESGDGSSDYRVGRRREAETQAEEERRGARFSS